ncbi:Gfo/Idh/MocA family oxidoreductase [Zoogloea sp.]|uniref:Gfo/Idh/MocA family protein n=1 Tax=Zoogloea sp. TaxID=49181 RepID=UPI00262EB92B|nr:Gfo/Idh/MocA family oxidoreductase [Zoogloea sp.]
MGKKKLRLALIGLGKQGLEHLNAADLCEDIVFVAGVDPSPETRQRVLESGNGMQVLESLESLDPAMLDGLVLALPHHRYTEAWDALLALGLPILKEKPLGRSFDEALSLLDRARAAGCPVQTAIQRRHHPSYRLLKQTLETERIEVREVHAHMHLGFTATTGGVESWRDKRHQAGGGALLDAGYHLVDLLHFMFGPFDLVSASLWRNGQPIGDNEIDERAWLTGRAEKGWIMLDSWLAGQPDPKTGKPIKSERLILKTSQGIWEANREGIWHDELRVATTDREWHQAMAGQLDGFAAHIRSGRWHDELIWDQLPAMRVIDEAYRLAARY